MPVVCTIVRIVVVNRQQTLGDNIQVEMRGRLCFRPRFRSYKILPVCIAIYEWWRRGVEERIHWSYLPMMRCPGNNWSQFPWIRDPHRSEVANNFEAGLSGMKREQSAQSGCPSRVSTVYFPSPHRFLKDRAHAKLKHDVPPWFCLGMRGGCYKYIRIGTM